MRKEWNILTLWGAFNNRCIPGNWVQIGTPSLKLNIGGLEGSGKLVLLNGSVSSRYWTLQSNAMPEQPGHTPSREVSYVRINFCLQNQIPASNDRFFSPPYYQSLWRILRWQTLPRMRSDFFVNINCFNFCDLPKVIILSSADSTDPCMIILYRRVSL